MSPDAKQPVYTLAGLGADQRMLDRLDFPPGVDRRPLPWLPPRADETICSYAARLAEGITDPNPIRLGVSFGGVMALELSRHVSPARTIIISSVKSPRELPWYLRLVGMSGLHRIVPSRTPKWWRPVIYYFNGVATDNSRRLIDAMIADNDRVLTRWMLNSLMSWRGCEPRGPVSHIHGSADRLLPYRCVRGAMAIKNGHHFMVFDEPGRVSRVIATCIKPNRCAGD